MIPLAISAYTTVSTLGRGAAAALAALREERSGLQPCDFADAVLPTWVGAVAGLDETPLSGAWAEYDCRNNRLACMALQHDDFAAAVAVAVARYGASRVGVFIGTSTAGILSTELAYRGRDEQGRFSTSFDFGKTQDVYSAAAFCRRWLALEGPALSISTACTSGAKTFAVASRYIQAGLCDAAVVGGVDSLCLTTLYGFNSLQLLAAQPCRPWDSQRDGLSLGEAAGFVLLQAQPPPGAAQPRVWLRGYGESSDAYHMSSADPAGTGAQQAMRQALERAQLTPSQIDYINVHGTATPANDSTEDNAITGLFGSTTPCSSTKGWTGHTLGAAGALEAIFACLCIEHDFMPASLNTVQPDPALSARILLQAQDTPVHTVLSNSFGFGGTNCSLIFAQEAA